MEGASQQGAGASAWSAAYNGATALQLYQSATQYIIACPGFEHTLRFSRLSGAIESGGPVQTDERTEWPPVLRGDISAVLGVLDCFSCPVLAVASKAHEVCTFAGQEVFGVDEVHLIPINASQEVAFALEGSDAFKAHYTHQSSEDSSLGDPELHISVLHDSPAPASVDDTGVSSAALTEAELKLLPVVAAHLVQGCYFSLTGHLTRSMQAATADKATPPSLPGLPRHLAMADTRFFWNWSMLGPLLHVDGGFWCPAALQGFVATTRIPVDDATFQFALISRRSRFRAGTRFNKRGLDREGNVANFVETEQILNAGRACCSYTQIRGSVPLFWTQPGTFEVPALQKTPAENREAAGRHLERLQERYGRLCVLNLLGARDKEKQLCESYERLIFTADDPDITYLSFDFHGYTKGRQFQNISVLRDLVRPQLAALKFAMFAPAESKPLLVAQQGVVRTNCMDCLDRTNIVQMEIGKLVLEKQLATLAILTPDDDGSVSLPEGVQQAVQGVWTANGDLLSRQYAGTRAMKRDYTKTGKASFVGSVKDTAGSVSRAYRNTFKDGLRQIALDAILGAADVGSALVGMSPNDFDGDDQLPGIVSRAREAFVPSGAHVIGHWVVRQTDVHLKSPAVLFLTSEALVVAYFSRESWELISHRTIAMKSVQKVERGASNPRDTHYRKLTPSKLKAILKKKKGHSVPIVRIFFKADQAKHDPISDAASAPVPVWFSDMKNDSDSDLSDPESLEADDPAPAPEPSAAPVSAAAAPSSDPATAAEAGLDDGQMTEWQLQEFFGEPDPDQDEFFNPELEATLDVQNVTVQWLTLIAEDDPLNSEAITEEIYSAFVKLRHSDSQRKFHVASRPTLSRVFQRRRSKKG